MDRARAVESQDKALWVLLAGWAVLAVASLWLRPLWPVDETRYASVAWEMWLRGDFLVPHINGETYSHKPPLLFWLIHAGWAVFGVNEWWPRMIGPLCALAAVPLTLRLGELLWPEEREARLNAVWLLFGTLLFVGFVTLLMFDLLLMLCAMAGMIGVLNLSNKKRIRGLLWLGAGIGLGVLAKGPVILLHVLPAALVAPWWKPEMRQREGRSLSLYYLDLLLGVLLGAAIALAWALPAAYFGGEVYQRAIFWGQTAGRVSESFAHRAAWWHYLPLLPVLLFPWIVWPRFWIGLKASRKEGQQHSTKFLLAWLVLTVVGFSLVSGKQGKYLVPFLPAFALLAGYALSRARRPERTWEILPPMLGFLALPAGLAWLRLRPESLKLPEWVGEIPLWPIIVLALVAPALLLVCLQPARLQLRALSFAVLGAAATLVVGVIPAFAPYADPAPTARYVAKLQENKTPVAHLGKYHATYNFSGRLRAPVAILGHDELAAWVRRNPDGRVLTVERMRAANGGPEVQWAYRGAWLQLWRGEALLVARPELR
ncbi:MAG: glycosyltransferase family 39 protein [Candidatus Parcubacteria bacterium]|nr:glycosyltransferase family 39 protein [Burkholderiales bacterium]